MPRLMLPEEGEDWLADVFGDAGAAPPIDPLARLLDPRFTPTLWEYEHSRTDPEIPGQLHAKQQAVLESDARHRWLFWGNQVGKTTIGAVECALLALGRHPFHQHWNPPLTGWASALTWELWEKILLPELLTWLPPDRIIDAPEPYVHSTKRDILVRADNGKVSRITGKAAQQGADMYQSARVHFVWLDEEHPESVWNEMQPRLLRHGGITIATMTPLKGFTWVYHRVYEPWQRGETGPDVFCSHAGLRDNPAIGEPEIAAMADALKHNPAQLAARLDGKFVRAEGLAVQFDPDRDFEDISDDDAHALVALGQAFGGVDFGSWRFAFTLWAADRAGVARRIDEFYDQRQTGDVEGARVSPLERRAKRLIAMAAKYGLETLKIWGDAANPTDIAELNSHLMRLESKLRVIPVAMENKIRSASVDRINDLLGRGALKFRRGVMDGETWLLGYNAANAGVPVEGSRLMWELNNWQYPKPAEAKAQKQDPDDNTADGADAIASMRYALMSWWRPAKAETPPPKPTKNRDQRFDKIFERLEKQQRAEQRARQRAERRFLR